MGIIPAEMRTPEWGCHDGVSIRLIDTDLALKEAIERCGVSTFQDRRSWRERRRERIAGAWAVLRGKAWAEYYEE